MSRKRPRVVLESAAGEVWPGGYDLARHKSSKKLVSALDVVGSGESQVSALSCHCSFLATVTQKDDTNLLFIVNIVENSFYLWKRMVERCTALRFHPYQENSLFMATASCKVYRVSVEDGTVVVMEGHSQPVVGVEVGSRSPLVLTYNIKEVLQWSWPSMALTNRLRHDNSLDIIWAGHVWQRDELLVAYHSGSVLLWSSRTSSTQTHIEPPDGLEMEFTSYAVSRGGEWLVGGGRGHLLVTYCLLSRCVAQVVQLPPSCTDVSRIFFLPPLHPRYPQVLAVLTSVGALHVIDFTTTTRLKTLRTQRHMIDGVCVCEDGSFMGVTYDNSTTKVYPLRALLPPAAPREVEPAAKAKEEVAFQIIDKKEKEEEEEETKREKKKAVTKDLQELLDKNKWYRILLEFGSFPDKYRLVIWASMLGMPRNYSAFSALLDKGTHPAYEELSEVYQLTDVTLFKALQRTLSCLAHWAPFLSQVPYLPELVFPFVKVYRTNLLLAFEVAATVILNWCRLWFEFFPEAAVTVMNVVEQLVCEADSSLLAHLMRLGVTAEQYVWPLLTTVFSKVLSSSDWLVLWDHLLSNTPSLLPCVAAAFTLTSRHTLLSCADAGEVMLYYSQETWVPIKKVLDCAYKLHKNKTEEHSLSKIFGSFTPLPPGGLPLFNIGPRPALPLVETDGGKHSLVSPRSSHHHTLQGPPLQDHKRQQRHQREQEEMVYVIGKQELEQQEEECLNSIWRLRRKHLAAAPP